MDFSQSTKQLITNFINSITSKIDNKISDHNNVHGSTSNFGHTKAGGVPQNVSNVGSAGTDNGYYARADHVHKASFNDLADKPNIPSANATASNIKMNGTQSAGSLTTFAKADHVHPVDTSRAPSTHNHTSSQITDLMSKVYPVGAIYISVNIEPSPATLFGGTWRRLEDTFLYATSGTADTGYQATDGSANAVVVKHTHTQKPHNHTQNPHNHTQNQHRHAMDAKFSNATGSSTAYTGTSKRNETTRYTDYQTPTINNQTATNQEQTAENNETGEDGTGKNMPPYMKVYMWKRTA